MLTELSVRNLGTVKSAKLEFKPGLSVLTGETGAGKSMLLTGLRLLMGGRADSKMVRVGEVKAEVSGVWSITNAELCKDFESRSVALEDDELYINRFVQEDGKSRLMLSGNYIPTSAMGEIASNLVEIHGQSDQFKLRNPTTQRSILDSFGSSKVAKANVCYSVAFNEWKKLKLRLKELQENSSRLAIEHRCNQDLLNRFLEISPEHNEIDSLEAEIEKIAHLEDIADGLKEAITLVLPEEVDSPYSILDQTVTLLMKLAKYDPKLAEVADMIDLGLRNVEAGIQELENYAESIDLESLQKLHELEDRL